MTGDEFYRKVRKPGQQNGIPVKTVADGVQSSPGQVPSRFP